MARTPVTSDQLVALIVTALNNATVNTGTLTAKAQGHSVQVHQHTDQADTHLRYFDIQVR